MRGKKIIGPMHEQIDYLIKEGPSIICLICCGYMSLKRGLSEVREGYHVSLVSYSRPSLMIIALASQFHIYLPWDHRPFSIVP